MRQLSGVFFNIHSEVAADEVRDVVLASRLLRGEHITQDCEELVLNIIAEGREPEAMALDEAAGPPGTPTHNLRIGVDMSIFVQATPFRSGM